MLLSSCAPQGSGILGNQTSIATAVDNVTAQAPFAYDIVPDTISYNSCVAQSVVGSPSGIKAFKIGVNEGFTDKSGNGAVQGGLKLKSDFLQYIGKKLKPSSSNATISSSQIKDVLAKSTLNQSAYLQFSVRRKNDLKVRVDVLAPTVQPAFQYAQVDRDVVVFQNSLASGEISNLLTKDIQFTTTGSVLSEGKRVYNLSESASANPIEASFEFNKTSDESFLAPTAPSTGQSREVIYGVAEYYAHKVREDFNTNDTKVKNILTAAFGGVFPESAGYSPTPGTSASTIAQLIRPSTSSSSSVAYGRGFELGFSSKSQTGVAGWVKNTLTAVKEIDLSTGQEVVGPRWSCSNYVIVKSNHWDNKKLFEPTCAPMLATDLTTARTQAIKKIRRHYSENDWNVGLFYPANTEPTVSRANLSICLSSKAAACYLPTSAAEVLDFPYGGVSDIGVNYDPTTECYLSAYEIMGVTYSSSLTSANDRRKLGRCAQYASICTRLP